MVTVYDSDLSARDGYIRRIAPMTSSPVRGVTRARAEELGAVPPKIGGSVAGEQAAVAHATAAMTKNARRSDIPACAWRPSPFTPVTSPTR